MAALSLVPGLNLGRYELLLPIAQGGMAQVWVARLTGTRGFRKVYAIKALHAGVADYRMEDMLLEEAKLASLIQHPNVVGTIELGEEEGLLYLVMEWVDGLPLSELMRSEPAGRMPIPVAVHLLAQICRGMHAAHELRDESGALLGLVHRDISPQNILIPSNGVAKIVDFGVAKATARDAGLTQDGELKGKIAYMSPEQIAGGSVDRRTDVFALGVMAYLMITGVHPFRGQTAGETVRNICGGREVRPLREFAPDVPDALQGIIFRMMSREMAERTPSAQAALSELELGFPEWVHTSMEGQVAAYLRQHCGDALSERAASIQRAHEELDNGSMPRSGTLRALSLSANSRQAQSSESRRRQELMEAAENSADLAAPRTPPRVFPWGAMGVSFGVAVLLSVLVLRLSAPKESASAASSVAAPAAPAVTTGTATAPPVGEALAPAPVDEQPEEPVLNRPAMAPSKRWRPSGSGPAKSTSPAPSDSPSSVAPPTKKKVDAWDPNSFGDRR